MFIADLVLVHGIRDIGAALARHDRIVLRSAPGAGAFAGAGFWRALVALAHQQFPGRIEADILDCADAPGAAMAALRAGCRHVALDAGCPAFYAVSAAAAAIGASVLPRDKLPALE